MSYLAQEGTTAFELKAKGGHKVIKSVERYAHLNAQLSKECSRENAQENLWEWLKTDTQTDTNGFSENLQNRNQLVLLVWQGSSVG